MTVKFTNNASTTVATGINTTATSLVVASAAGFPTLSGSGDYCYLTIQQAAGTVREVVKATALSTNTFTIVRAQDGTSAGSWSVSDVVELRVTAALLTDILDDATHDSSVLSVDSTNNRVGVNDTTPSVTLDISGTDAIALPVGTTAQRPSGAAGRFRYNSSLSQFEGYTDAWGAIGGGGTNTFTTDTFTANGSLVAFNLSQTVSSESNLLVFIDGVFQTQDAYAIATASGTTTLTFSAAPANARKIVVYSVAAGISGANLNIDSMTGDGSDVTLTLSLAPVTEQNTQVFIDGVYQNKSTYSTSGTTLTFSTPPPTGSAVEVVTMTQTEINVPVDGTITPAKIASGDFYFDTNTLYIDATNNRVGIGTSSPSAPLTVNGTNAGIRFTDADQGASNYYGEIYKDYNGNAPFVIQSKSNGTGVISLNPDGGSVGVGTNSPRSVANYSVVGINGTSGSAIDFELGEALKTSFTQSAGQFEINVVPALPLIFKTSNAERMLISADGAVRMTKGGTAFTPLQYDGLVVQNGDATGIRIIDAGDGGGNGGHTGIGNDNGNLRVMTAGVMTFATGLSPTDQLYQGGDERMRIASSGLVGIGTAQPGATLHVDPAANVTTGFGTPLIKVGGDNSWAGNGSLYSIGFGYTDNSIASKSPAEIGFATTTNAGYTKGDLHFATRNVTTNTAPITRMSISDVGALFVPYLRSSSSANSDVRFNTSNGELYYQTSSERYKSNIADLEFDTSNLYDLRPVSFDDNETGERCFGLIAEETFEQIPEAVVTRDIGGETVPDSIPYSMLSVLIINELKKLKVENDSLKARLTALESK